jgi:hypothetical protein
VVQGALAQAGATVPAPPGAPAWDRLTAILAGFCGWASQHDPLARVLVRECLMGTPGLYAQVIGAEWPLNAQLEAIIRTGIRDSELRADLPADLLALAVAGLTRPGARPALGLRPHQAHPGGDSRPRAHPAPRRVIPYGFSGHRRSVTW